MTDFTRANLPLGVADGRAHDAHGDEVVLRAWVGDGDHRVGFGELRGSIVP